MSGAQDLLLGNFSTVAAAYQIERSLRFNSADSAYLNRTPASAGNLQKFTWSGWVKPTAFSAARRLFSARVGLTGDQGFIQLASDDTILIAGNSGAYELRTTQVFRDPSAWYHFVWAVDTTQATSSNRIKLYVNGAQVTAFSTSTYPSQNLNTWVNTTSPHSIGAETGTPSEFFNGYMADINFIDGQQLTPSSFGQTNSATGVWEPIAYTGTYGTNGFYLKFADNSGTTSTTLGKDSSGNSNNWTPNNFSVTAGAGNDSLVDSPTQYGTDTGAGGEVRGNYCTWNPLANLGLTLSNGNLTNSYTTNAWTGTTATISMPSGKWYFEYTVNATATYTQIGVITTGKPLPTGGLQLVNGTTFAWGYQTFGTTFGAGTDTSSGITSATTNDVISVAVDIDAGKIWLAKNGTFFNSGAPASGTNAAYTNLSGSMTPVVFSYGTESGDINFGQRPFAYTAPSGFKALCTTNLPTPTIGATATTRADDYFNAVLYTGTGSTLSVTGIGFQPDLVWIKRTNSITDHGWYDAVRGVQQQLESNTTTDETTESTGLTAFGADGFTVGSLAQLNNSSAPYVAWNWKETATAGFDIVTYTGNGTARTISHNLGVAPNMIIVKARTTASTDQGWPVYHSANTSAPETDYLMLNTDAATADLDTVWNDTAPTSSVFSVGTNANVNANNDTYVAYLFTAIANFSAFGSYTGNGSSDGPFIYTGFRPKWIMIKSSSNASLSWVIFDTARNLYNSSGNALWADLSSAEATYNDFDILSNGFKLRFTSATANGSGYTYVYAAFAEVPTKFALAR